jgi:bacillithiol system protein YtxJ
MTRLKPLADLDELEAAIAESRERPVLLFKHSRRCGVSCEALDELHAHIARHDGDTAYRLITVQTHRPLAEAAASRLGIRHESPQALLLRAGRVVWNASHFRITAEALDAATTAD